MKVGKVVNIKEVKKKAKVLLKKHFFRNIIIAFISYLIINGGYSYVTSFGKQDLKTSSIDSIYNINIKKINKNSKSNAEIIYEIIYNTKKNINYKKVKTKNEIKSLTTIVINKLTKYKSFALSFLNSVNKVIFKEKYEVISIISFLIILYFAYSIFIKYPFIIGKTRYFIEKNKYEDTKAEKLFFTYRVKKSISVSFSMFLKDLYQLLWNFTIIGGFIKHYSYFLVPYVLAENPNIKAKDAINLSRNMMNGYKLKLFLLDISLIPWTILGMLTFNLSDILYYEPYKELIYSVFYMKLKETNKINNIELINDDLLKGDTIKGFYPEDELSKKFKTYTIIDELNYDRKYNLVSMILLFFTFSFVGWFWEVFLYFIENGEFVNRGTMHGPWLPIYGFGGILILKVLKPFRKNPWLTFALACVLCGILEYSTGWYLETFKHMKWWDYTGYILNIKGRVCIEGLITFGLGGCAFTYIFAPLIDNLFKKISPNIKKTLCIILILFYLVDLIYSNNNPNSGNGITNEIESDAKIYEKYNKVFDKI